MSIGDKPINAIFTENGYCREASILTKGLTSGLTYREWLIGMLASNPNLMAIDKDSGKEYLMSPINTVRIISTADAIIKQLDKEVK